MIKRVAPDKWKHFFVGIGMGALLQGFTSFLLSDHLAVATVVAFVLVVIISYGFELFSKTTGLGIYDIMDAVASAVGGVLGMSLALIAGLYIF
jgi:Na+/H+-translocating membrane pyrophosphatase